MPYTEVGTYDDDDDYNYIDAFIVEVSLMIPSFHHDNDDDT
jgi:hypothetical protein